MRFSKLNPVPAIVKGTKVSASATAKAAKVSGLAIKSGTLFATDHMEYGLAKAHDAVNNSVVVPVTKATVRHRDAVGDRMIARMYARDDKKAANS